MSSTNMGKLLISDNGKRLYVIMSILVGLNIFGIIFLFSSATEALILLPMLGLAFTGIFSFAYYAPRARTEIYVYENVILGRAIAQSFISAQDFSVTYDKITQVDIQGQSAVVIYTPHSKYICYCSNAAKVQNTISKHQKVSVGEGSTPSVQAPAQPTAKMDPLVRRAFMCLEDGEWEKADNFFEQALNTNPENAHAYVGKLCVELQINRPEDLLAYEPPIAHYSNYKRALQFADKEHRATLELYALAPGEQRERREEEMRRKEEEIKVSEAAVQNILDKLERVTERRELAECKALVSEIKELAKTHEGAAELLREIGAPIVLPGDYIDCWLCGCRQSPSREQCFRCGIDFVKPEATV